MNLLVTGSSGWLGQTLVPRLKQAGHTVIGLDTVPSQTTSLVGSIADFALVRQAVFDHSVDGIIHAAALHKPNISTCTVDDFLSVNVQGTLNLLRAAVEPGSKVDRFIFTSTTSLMISREIRAGLAGGARRASWVTEDMHPLLPRNIYGVTKLSAEHLCRMFHEMHDLPVITLRTSRFFPEEDDMHHTIVQSEPNTKANELLFRRLSVEDAADCHMMALEKAPRIGFDTFIVSAKTPFREVDCEQLLYDAPIVVERYFPQYVDIYAQLGWTMFASIDRVYVSTKMEEKLGFVCKTDFARALKRLEMQLDKRSSAGLS